MRKIKGEVGIGAAQGYGEFAWDATRELVLTWAFGGLYQAIQGYHFYSTLYAGYDEKGWLGALSVLNPLAGILTPAENATHEAVKGDYRAAGREGIKSIIAAAITVVTVAIGPKTPGPGGKPPSAAGGAAKDASGATAVSLSKSDYGSVVFCDFDPTFHVAIADVKIKPTGSRRLNRSAANKAAGLPETPDGYTWHHHQEHGRMQLVPSELHQATGHTGGFSLW